MKKNQKWQLVLILAVMVLTIYNILPTLFYYIQPLRAPIDVIEAQKISQSISSRVDELENETKEWLGSFCDLLHVKPLYIEPVETHPQWMKVGFTKNEEAVRFRSHLPRAGSLIPFVPAKLALAPGGGTSSKEVFIQRLIPSGLKPECFVFSDKKSPLYYTWMLDRATQLAITLGVAPQFNHSPTRDVLNVGWRHPLFSELMVDWKGEKIELTLKEGKTSTSQEVIDEIAKLTRTCNEKIDADGSTFTIRFHTLPNAAGFLVLDLQKIAISQINELKSFIQSQWHPKHPDLAQIFFCGEDEYETLSSEQKALCLIFVTPHGVHPIPSLENPSLYIVAKGMGKILKNYEATSNSPQLGQFQEDIVQLSNLLQSHGFFGFRPESSLLSDDFVFECPDFSCFLLAATREEFVIRGTQRYAFLEMSDREQRILTENKIEGKIHEDLLKWDEEYRAACVSLNASHVSQVPKPTRNVFWNNVILSFRKMMRGDERKILRWGLDLSGGKTIQIELQDMLGKAVTSDEEIKQGINELYQRINKMGVSDIAIRQMGHHIVIDFPGLQAFSAEELIQSSTMVFHVVNEKFSPLHEELSETSQRFLQEVWNQAVVFGKKDAASLQQIAFDHLKSEAGKALLSHGLQLKDPSDHSLSSELDDTFSQIAILRGEHPRDWGGQSHPLLIVFSHHALEGSELANIHASYDPSKGNFLSFDIQNSESIYQWSSRYCKENIPDTPLEAYSRGHGWRMAVILNGSVINAPTLNEPLQNHAMISGHFSPREVQVLATDLKAGSLSFTPHILSEKNVSPELGKTDRMQGIVASAVAFFLVIASMVIYYRFSGVIASIAVLFNLLILWATLQNLGASLSLAGIAGIILTVGMAVDANVLVFERIREEFSHSSNIRSALQAGYEKAYSAIIDSNVTTILAGLILLNFDSGPIKSFAINLIIGIGSSMFTALFMTRFYFTRWAQNPKHTVLKMASWIRSTSFDFLKWAKPSFVITMFIIGIGGALLIFQKNQILGMDFTGGYSLYLELEPLNDKREIEAVEETLLQTGITSRDFQIRELTPKNHLRILFGTSMQQKGKPFASLPPFGEIEWVVNTLQKEGIVLTKESLKTLPSQWTVISSQMSDTMQNHAIMGLLISFICIFIYLAFRFEYKFAAAALICLLHDVGITLGLLGILYTLGVPIQIDLNTIAALMTIIGYSLNDTIIIFDRIREEMHLKASMPLSRVVNSALNATLSRTTITSGTTLLVVIALLLFGGPSIFSFSLVMTLGVFFGTLSSWFIASPLMLYFHKREEKGLAPNR